VAVPVNARMCKAEVALILTHAQPAAVPTTTAISTEAQAHTAWMQASSFDGPWGQFHLALPYASSPDEQPDLAAIL